MIRGITTVLVIAAIAMPATNHAQENQVAYVYASYFICDPAGEARADEIIARNFRPHYDAAVESGHLVSWSWLAHFVGGEWRRALVIAATNMDDLLDSSGALGEVIEDTTPEAGRAFTEVCPEHVDYVWESIPGISSSVIGGERGPAGFSMYFDCDVTREERIDELMREEFAPIYNRQVESGGLASWAWLKHNVGGTHRRLLTMTGEDHKLLARTRAALQQEFGQRRNERAMREASEICHTHSDYMWDIRQETP